MDFGDDGVGLVEVADLASISGAADEVFDDVLRSRSTRCTSRL